MSVYTKKNIKIKHWRGLDLSSTFYQPRQAEYKATLLYFHGGGFVFGNREDLPEEYINLFTSNGIGIVSVDYPLAPEMKLEEIIESAHQTTQWFINEFLITLEQDSYFIMGRSAGAFLALTTGDYLKKFANRPLGIISLYGYFNLNDASFSVPNRTYLKYAKVNDRIVSTLIQKEPVLVDKHQNRFPIYLASRQKGDWMDLVLSTSNQKYQFSLSHEQLKNLPPLFVSAATKDPDVPSSQSRQLAQLHPNADLHLVKLSEHDFDRTHIKKYGVPLYKEIVEWILLKL